MDLVKNGVLKIEDVEELEKELNTKLPDDYVEFLMQSNGGFFDEAKMISIDGIASRIGVEKMWGYNTGYKSADILTWTKQYVPKTQNNTVIIGADYANNNIIMITKDEDKGIYYWDSRIAFENSTEDECVYWIADTFSEFIEILDASGEHQTD